MAAVRQFFEMMAGESAPFSATEGSGGPERADLVGGFCGCDLHPFKPRAGDAAAALLADGTAKVSAIRHRAG
jgi:hypothetical protein